MLKLNVIRKKNFDKSDGSLNIQNTITKQAKKNPEKW